MPVPGLSPCFYCNGTDHWHDKCWTRKPPTSREHHEARIATYRDWCAIQQRVTPHQKRQLIEHENKMWRDTQPKKERKAS